MSNARTYRNSSRRVWLVLDMMWKLNMRRGSYWTADGADDFIDKWGKL